MYSHQWVVLIHAVCTDGYLKNGILKGGMPKEFFMKTNVFGKAGAALLLALVLGLSGCATYATRDGIVTPLGALTSPKVNEPRGEVIAEYQIILGLITSGYEKFLEDTKGKNIDIIDENYLNLFRNIKAVARK
jgi:hypothetical protein